MNIENGICEFSRALDEYQEYLLDRRITQLMPDNPNTPEIIKSLERLKEQLERIIKLAQEGH